MLHAISQQHDSRDATVDLLSCFCLVLEVPTQRDAEWTQAIHLHNTAQHSTAAARTAHVSEHTGTQPQGPQARSRVFGCIWAGAGADSILRIQRSASVQPSDQHHGDSWSLRMRPLCTTQPRPIGRLRIKRSAKHRHPNHQPWGVKNHPRPTHINTDVLGCRASHRAVPRTLRQQKRSSCASSQARYDLHHCARAVHRQQVRPAFAFCLHSTISCKYQWDWQAGDHGAGADCEGAAVCTSAGASKLERLGELRQLDGVREGECDVACRCAWTASRGNTEAQTHEYCCVRQSPRKVGTAILVQVQSLLIIDAVMPHHSREQKLVDGPMQWRAVSRSRKSCQLQKVYTQYEDIPPAAPNDQLHFA